MGDGDFVATFVRTSLSFLVQVGLIDIDLSPAIVVD